MLSVLQLDGSLELLLVPKVDKVVSTFCFVRTMMIEIMSVATHCTIQDVRTHSPAHSKRHASYMTFACSQTIVVVNNRSSDDHRSGEGCIQ